MNTIGVHHIPPCYSTYTTESFALSMHYQYNYRKRVGKNWQKQDRNYKNNDFVNVVFYYILNYSYNNYY